MRKVYKPVVLSTRQSQYGYWVVTVSTAPGLRAEITCCRLGLTRDDAQTAALAVTPFLPERRAGQ